MTYNYLLQHNNHTLKLWVSETEMPTIEKQSLSDLIEPSKESFDPIGAWRMSAKSYNFANEENERLFVSLACDLSFKEAYENDKELSFDKGILIPEDRIKLVIAQDGPKVNQTIAYFAQPSPVLAEVEEESQEELWSEVSTRIYNDSNEWKNIKSEFTITRKQTK